MESLTKTAAIFGLFFFTACGSELPRTLKAPLAQSEVGAGEYLEGQFFLSDGTSQDLSALRDRPLVFMLAGEFCSTCIHEVGVFKNALSPSILEEQIRFRSVLVGNTESGADEWKNTHSVPWPVGFQDGDSLFQKWCPERTTPCLIIQTPENGVVLRKTGAVSVTEIEALTGAWKRGASHESR